MYKQKRYSRHSRKKSYGKYKYRSNSRRHTIKSFDPRTVIGKASQSTNTSVKVYEVQNDFSDFVLDVMVECAIMTL